MTILLILSVIWMVFGVIISVPGVTYVWTDYEINGFSLKLALMILLFGPLFWLGIATIFVLYLLDNILH